MSEYRSNARPIRLPAAFPAAGCGMVTLEGLILPPALEPGWGQFGVADRVLDVLVPEVGLQRSRIPSGISLVEAASVSEHVRVNLDFELGGLASPVDELLEVGHRHRRAALGHEQER